MNDGDLLLRAVLADPAEDTPRLAYADWLEEHGGRPGAIHARFVRAQAAGEVAVVPLTVLTGIEYLLGCQPHACGRAAGRGWAGAESPAGVSVTYRRGFVDEVRCPVTVWVRLGPRAARTHPVTRVVLADRRANAYVSSRRGELTPVVWRWDICDASDITYPGQLPGFVPREFYPRGTFRSHAEADVALSRRCLAWARAG